MREFVEWSGWRVGIIVSCALVLILAGSFVARYHYLSGGAWHRTPEGRWTLYRRAVEALVSGVVLSLFAFPGWPGRRFALFVAMALYAAQTFVPHHLLSRAHRDHEHKGRDHGVEDKGCRHRRVPGEPGRAGVAH